MKRNLTPRQQAFVREYLVDLNATQAAIRAGYAKRTANREGARLLSNVDIANAIHVGQQQRAERVEISTDRVVSELAAIGFTRERTVTPAARVRALELLGKHLGMFTERYHHDHSFDLQDDDSIIAAAIEYDMVDRLPAELREKAERRLAESGTI